MRLRPPFLVLALAAAVGFAAGVGLSEDEPGGEENPWAALAAPGPQHEYLAGFVGSWTTEGKFWMQPGQPPIEAGGTYTCVMRCDGRYLAESYDGDFAGDKFHGEGYVGFNNATQQFEHVWLDTMGTGVTLTKGAREGDAITLTGEVPLPGVGTLGMREVNTRVSADEFRVEAYHTMPGTPEVKVMEIVFRRSE